MKNPTLLPKLTAPVERPAVTSSDLKQASSVDAAWLNGDNNWSTPFAGVNAAWLNGDNNWSTPFAADGAE
ncbi:MAG: hypothetical protein EWV67_02510 [Microcystis sp. M_QC_C_20170808_M2Col]|jgi:hypothetical protein|uniref:hypothetical protein n=1 Tax=Microcystis sp. M_QC_C_20170808_M2Col TaxID=2486215 RepID=UPI00119665FA|nr:hypothetical protein [Microcystis sp. M_QC_C_20170808_M2Col]TRT68367.1 MAG: hypothetical protein EWV67_02510 [Microcystis sp. M_QC_C_20170808_M2Col]